MFELIHADCIEVLRNMSDKSVDCIITDPPYGVGIDYGDTYQDTRGNLELLAREALPEMRRVARRVAFTCGTRNLNLGCSRGSTAEIPTPRGAGVRGSQSSSTAPILI